MGEPEPEYIVSDGISNGATWATYRRRRNGSLQRVKSPHLPLRATREQAEHDLAVYLAEQAPARRQDRARRAARLFRFAESAMRRGEVDRAVDRRRDAWRELELGVNEPAHPDLPMPEINIVALASAVGWPDDVERVLDAYGQGEVSGDA